MRAIQKSLAKVGFAVTIQAVIPQLVYRSPRLTDVYEHQVLGEVDLTALGVAD